MYDRSPAWFDFHRHYKGIYESTRTSFGMDLEIMTPVTLFDYSVNGEESSAYIMSMMGSMGSVIINWDKGGIRLGGDWRSLGINRRGANSSDFDVFFTDVLVYAAVFHQEWSVSLGSIVRHTPILDSSGFTGGERTIPGFFCYYSAPYFEGGLTVSKLGVEKWRQLNPIKIFKAVLKAFGPLLEAYPRFALYKLGLFVDEVYLDKEHASVSSAVVTDVYPGFGLNRATVKVTITLFRENWEDVDFRDNTSETDIYLQIDVGGSYFAFSDAPEDFGSNQPWGGGMKIRALNNGGGGGFAAQLSFGYNYYEDLLSLPIPNAPILGASFWFGL